MRKRLLGVGVALAGMGATLGVFGSTAGAAQLNQSGWWYRPQGTGGVISGIPAAVAAPGAPDGALMVSGTPEGPTAIAAVRYTLSDSESEPTLELSVAQDLGGQAAQIAACPAGSDWAPASAGDWNSKPIANCGAGQALGTRSADGKTFTFGIAQFVNDGVADVVLTPVAGSSFSLTFTKPTSESLKTTGGGEDAFASDFDSSDALASGGADFGSIDTFSDSTLSAPVIDGGSFDTALSTPAAPSVVAPLPPQRQISTPAAVRKTPLSTSDKGKALALLLALGALAAGWFVSQQQTPALRMLGSFAEGRGSVPATTAAGPQPQVGGLGRFARLRQGAPPSL